MFSIFCHPYTEPHNSFYLNVIFDGENYYTDVHLENNVYRFSRLSTVFFYEYENLDEKKKFIEDVTGNTGYIQIKDGYIEEVDRELLNTLETI